MKLDATSLKLLMELQYRFPIEAEPFNLIALRLGLSVKDVLKQVRIFRRQGVLKKIGFYVNYRFQGLSASLIGLNVSTKKLELLRKIVGREHSITHAYVRDHPRYNVWIVLKSRSLENKLNEFSEKLGIDDIVSLPSLRTYKISVKYDLVRGVSWSNLFSTSEQLSIEKTREPAYLPRLLKEIRELPLNERPFQTIAKRIGISLGELLGTISSLVGKGVLSNYGASLNGTLLGFKHNAMVMVDCDLCCLKVARSLSEATHVVLRKSIPGKWPYSCYFMVHARRKRLVEEVVEKAERLLGKPRIQVLYSIEDLKPGVRR